MVSWVNYKVIIEKQAEEDLENILQYIAETLNAPDAAKKFYQKVKNNIASLCYLPWRCGLVAEHPYVQMGVRKLIIGNYIAFSTIYEAVQEVHVFRILYYRREWQNLI